MSSIAKLRHEFKKEKALMKKMMADAGDDMIRKPGTGRISLPLPVPAAHRVKLTIDPIKLEQTIKKACIPIEKKSVVVLENVPPPVATAAVAHVCVVAVCQARNLNGTPCKCKAKVGKFCAKHSG